MVEYISREAAIANRREYNLGGSYDNTELAVPVSAINSIPAADVRPVVRGTWLWDCDYRFRCSACGNMWTVSNGNPLDMSNGWDHCPHCGAKMEG